MQRKAELMNRLMHGDKSVMEELKKLMEAKQPEAPKPAPAPAPKMEEKPAEQPKKEEMKK